MQLVADVGSTDTKLAVFAPGDLRPVVVARLPTEGAAESIASGTATGPLLREMVPMDIRRIVIGSVSHGRTQEIRAALESVAPKAAMTILSGFGGLPLRPGPDGYPEGVGADRIANALAARELEDRDAIVVDAGTATTVDCIGVDGVFEGGAIAPGLASGAAGLRARAPHLPVVPLEPFSGSPIGRRTDDALRSGTFLAAVEGVEGLVMRIREAWERPGAGVLVTGGYARLLAAHSSTFVRVEPELTLVGLALAGEALSP